MFIHVWLRRVYGLLLSEVPLVGHSEIKSVIITRKRFPVNARQSAEALIMAGGEREALAPDVYSVAANPLSLFRDVTTRDGST